MIENIKVAALVPTRGDRPAMLANMHRMMRNQTFKPHGIVVMGDEPLDQAVKDLTYRYRVGLARVFAEFPDTDIVALVEDDDYYSPDYLQQMVTSWVQMGKPNTFGQAETHYYHLGIRAWHHQKHPDRSSAFTTLITKQVFDNMKWPKDDYSFVDMDIWKQFPGKTVKFDRPVAIGIKGYKQGRHFGGIGHNDKWGGYKNKDLQMSWLRSMVNDESFEFYKSIVDTLL